MLEAHITSEETDAEKEELRRRMSELSLKLRAAGASIEKHSERRASGGQSGCGGCFERVRRVTKQKARRFVQTWPGNLALQLDEVSRPANPEEAVNIVNGFIVGPAPVRTSDLI